MARTTQEQLDAVDLAIAAIEGGAQSYSIDNRSFTRADLAALYAERRRLTALLAGSTAGGMRTRLARPL